MRQNNIIIGPHSGEDLVDGSFNILLGEYAGKGEKNLDHTLIIKFGPDRELRETITEEDWSYFNVLIVNLMDKIRSDEKSKTLIGRIFGK